MQLFEKGIVQFRYAVLISLLFCVSLTRHRDTRGYFRIVNSALVENQWQPHA